MGFYISWLLISLCAHNKLGISICWRHLVTSKETSNPIFFFGKRPWLHHTCATWNEQPSNIKTMGWRGAKPKSKICPNLLPLLRVMIYLSDSIRSAADLFHYFPHFFSPSSNFLLIRIKKVLLSGSGFLRVYIEYI